MGVLIGGKRPGDRILGQQGHADERQEGNAQNKFSRAPIKSSHSTSRETHARLTSHPSASSLVLKQKRLPFGFRQRIEKQSPKIQFGGVAARFCEVARA